jgi:hypothetical protein
VIVSKSSVYPIAAGLCLVLFGGYVRVLSLKSRGWPVTSGVITESYRRTETKNYQKRTRGAEIRYRYTVDGQTYKGDVISYGDMFFASDTARLQRYPQGAQVEVHYDPQDPTLAVLEAGAGPSPGLFILGGLAAIGFGVWKSRGV